MKNQHKLANSLRDVILFSSMQAQAYLSVFHLEAGKQSLQTYLHMTTKTQVKLFSAKILLSHFDGYLQG